MPSNLGDSNRARHHPDGVPRSRDIYRTNHSHHQLRGSGSGLHFEEEHQSGCKGVHADGHAATADDDDDATDAEEKEIRAAKLSNNDIDCEAFKKGTLEKKIEQV